MSTNGKCPFPHEQMMAQAEVTGTKDPAVLPFSAISLQPLLQHNPKSNPMGEDFNYVEEFNKLDLDQVKEAIREAMTDSQSWWPADWGHYGPFFIRMAWHSAGTYRATDGRGGAGDGLQRFAPLNSWPDNVNLDKARRLLWPVKSQFGKSLSWADLMILAGNVALEDMGFPTFGFAGGRADVWEPDNTYWGPESEWLANGRYDSNSDRNTLENPLAAVQMGLIYVNPEGPDGNADDFVGSANDIRVTFARMAMNDEETVALIVGGHAFGKSHGAGNAAQVGPNPENAPLSQVGLGWKNSQGKGHSEDTISSGLEGAWTPTPLEWDNKYLELIYKYEWKKVLSPSGAQQWEPVDCHPDDMVPDAHVPGKLNKPMMLTTDLALRFGDDKYDAICKKFLGDFDSLTEAFSKAWFKLTHRDMGPISRYHGAEVPKEILLWQDPIAMNSYDPLSDRDVYNLNANLKKAVDDGKLKISDLVFTAYVSASSYRNTDKRGGANGARFLLEPQRSWGITDIDRTESVVSQLVEIANSLNLKISKSDLVVFAGSFAVSLAAKVAGSKSEVRFVGGRGDAKQEETDVDSFQYLMPVSDPFVSWVIQDDWNEDEVDPDRLSWSLQKNLDKSLIAKSALLSLTPPEMAVLFAGLRSLGVTHRYGVTGDRVPIGFDGESKISPLLFRQLLDSRKSWTGMGVVPGSFNNSMLEEWVSPDEQYIFVSQSDNGATSSVALRSDMLFASHSVLRAISEVYAANDGDEKFAEDFIKVWYKLMMLDRFDVAS
jgi:catalase-peroxidase